MSKGGKLTYAIHNINVHILNQASKQATKKKKEVGMLLLLLLYSKTYMYENWDEDLCV